MAAMPEHWIAPSKIGKSGIGEVLSADAGQRKAIAGLVGAEEVLSAKVEFAARQWRGSGILIEGTVRAAMMQTCVVSLDLFENQVETSFERSFVPLDPRRGERLDEELVLDPEAEDPPETFERDRIDVWAVALEHLVIETDLYPRKPDLEDQAGSEPEKADEEDTHRPFSRLSEMLDQKSSKSGE